MKILTLLLILAATIIFVLQNLEPISLVFLNAQIALQLPLAVWILLAVVAGMLTSALIQLLNRSNGRVQQVSFAPEEPPISPSGSAFGEFRQSRSPRYDAVDEPSYVRSEATTSSSTTTTTEKSDWDNAGEERDWNIEEPPQENFDRQNLQDKETPPSSSRSSSVYSYSYREAKNKSTTPDKKERIYDANYRVISPPYRQEENRKIEDEDNEEDWI
jgi:uncharacterized integral membrane protein